MQVKRFRVEIMAATADDPKHELNLDDVLSEIGSSGPFHVRIYCLLLVPVVMFSMYDMTYLFTSGALEYRWDLCLKRKYYQCKSLTFSAFISCKVPECDTSETPVYQQAWLSDVLPLSANGRPRQCERFTRTDNASTSETCPTGSFNKSHIERCTEFVYEDSDAVTLVNEVNPI